MTLYFAYGSNMNRAAMRAALSGRARGRAGDARGLQVFRRHRRLGIGQARARATACTACCGGSPRATWRRCTPTNCCIRACITCAVCRCAAARGALPAMIYLLRRRGAGRPKPGYVEMIAAAARAWKLPEALYPLGRALVDLALHRRARDRRRRTGMSVIRHMIVRGRVQGVGYRAFVEHEALRARPGRLGAQPPRRQRRGGVRGRGGVGRAT